MEKYIYNETRYTMLARSKPDQARWLLENAQEDVRMRWRLYEHWARMQVNGKTKEDRND